MKKKRATRGVGRGVVQGEEMLTLFSQDFQDFLSLKVWDVCNESTSSSTDDFARVRVPQVIDLRVS